MQTLVCSVFVLEWFNIFLTNFIGKVLHFVGCISFNKALFTLSRCMPRCVPVRSGLPAANCREGIQVRLYIPGSATDQTRFWDKKSSRSVPVMLQFATVHSRCSSGGATVCPGASRYTTVLESMAEPRCHYGESQK